MAQKSSRSPFDITAAVRDVCRDICSKVSIFRSYDLSRVGFSVSKSRGSDDYGVFASLTPLRFENGSRLTRRRGAFYTIPAVYDAQTKIELSYILTICVPRFTNRKSVKDKIVTLTHELYHISPRFDGDIRRFNGPKYAHGSSRKRFDAIASKIADEWLATDPDPKIWDFLRWNFDELEERFGGVVGWRFPSVPLKKISEAEARQIASAEKSR